MRRTHQILRGPPDADRAATPRSYAVAAWASLAAVCLLVFGLPAAIGRGADETPFDSFAVDALATADPDYVFIGDSLLETRIDAEYLSGLVGGRGAVSLADPGSRSAIWYLQLKNLVAGSGVSPKAVFVFFRDDLITSPTAQLTGQNRLTIEALSHGSEPEYDAIITANRDVGDRLTEATRWTYPVQLRRPDALDLVSRLAALPLRSDDETFTDRANDRFAFTNQRGSETDSTVPDTLAAFANVVGRSFLPAMLDVGRKHALRIVFVRVQARPNPDGTPRQSARLETYSDDLRAWLVEQGADYYDFTGDPEVDRGLYYDGYHIRQRYLADYTDLFVRRLDDIFFGDGAPQADGP